MADTLPAYKPQPVLNSPLKPPLRSTRTELFSADPLSADAMMQKVRRDYGGYIRLADTEKFLDELLPDMFSLASRTFAKLKQDNVYTAEDQWGDFPSEQSKYKEDDLYVPFVTVANKIANVAKDIKKEDRQGQEDEEQVYDASWVDYHSKAPRSHSIGGPKIRPDCLLALNAVTHDLKNVTSSKKEQQTVWWLQAVVAVEAKRGEIEYSQVIMQLLGYLRMIMVEQYDRRFAFGLAFNRSCVTVWQQHRSGVTGTAMSIDIHREPLRFIQIIAALATLPAHRLGFDPDMRLYWPEASAPVHTYRRASGPFDASPFKHGSYKTQWVVRTGGQDYLTLKALSLVRTDVVRGSGTMVWAAIKYDSRGKSPQDREVYVLKQAWVADGSEYEGDLYDLLKKAPSDHPGAKYVAQLEFHEKVMIDGHVDHTIAFVQRGIESAPPVEAPVTGKRSALLDLEPDLIHAECITPDEAGELFRLRLGSNAKDLQGRTRVRLILRVFGCSIRFFTSLPELVRLMRDCVYGHKFMYDNGVLQRDISPANLLSVLCHGSQGQQPAGLHGCLIDLDHAKRIQPISDRRNPVPTPPDADVDLLRGFFRSRFMGLDFTVDDSVIRRALALANVTLDDEALTPPTVRAYINATCGYNKRYNNGPVPTVYTATSLGWEVPILSAPCPPGIAPGMAIEKEQRSGTPPYASVMLVNPEGVQMKKRYGKLAHSNTFILHDAVHDMESCFWVIVYLCLTRAGPGGDRRRELTCERDELPTDPKERKAAEALRTTVWLFFDADVPTLAKNKRLLFQDDDFADYLLPHVHPYFEPLKPALLQWWDLLQLAYAFHGYEFYDIHNRVIELLDHALRTLEAHPRPEQAEVESAAKVKRDKFLANIVDPASVPPSSAATASKTPVTTSEIVPSAALDNTPKENKLQGSAHRSSPPPSPTEAIAKKQKVSKTPGQPHA